MNNYKTFGTTGKAVYTLEADTERRTSCIKKDLDV
tara:strand:- start:647 stop:751 length:105 start_codon:yes stop_codon:yes gene_type:complete